MFAYVIRQFDDGSVRCGYRVGELGVYGCSESPTSELNGLPGDYSGLSELGGYSMGRPDSEELSELGQGDCHSPVSSIDEIERAVAGNRTTSFSTRLVATSQLPVLKYQVSS